MLRVDFRFRKEDVKKMPKGALAALEKETHRQLRKHSPDDSGLLFGQRKEHFAH